MALVLAALALGALAVWPASAFERTEQREACAAAHPLRRPFFGDTHIHTSLSFDANALGVRNRPSDAYRFARGEQLGLQPYDRAGQAQRSAKLRRPLDFAVVTDHAEMLGEVRICETPGMAGYDSFMCRINRSWPLLSYMVVSSAMINESSPVRYSFCGAGGQLCLDAAVGAWQEIQAAAEAAYDRSSDCNFTTFVGYEWSGNPDSNMIHRNVIFRNQVVQEQPTNYVNTPSAEGLFQSLHSECLELENGCDVIAIPHNSNLSGGMLFRTEGADGTPLTKQGAERRAVLERLVEVIQHKGSSECRVNGAFAEDELCSFESLPFARMDEYPVEAWWSEAPQGSYVREVLGEGLVQQAKLGVNPFQLGLIGSTDSHLGTPGLIAEDRFPGHAAGGDTSRFEIPTVPDRLYFNPGGLAVVWAEENSRDAIFEAMRRREVYGTSGPRLSLRFFGGWDYPADLCEGNEFAAVGYAKGVPMGANLPPAALDQQAGPTLATWAVRDTGTADAPGGLLERVQIIKVWLEEGSPVERVYDVAGNSEAQADVDLASCAPRGPGFSSLCRVWRDPDFDAAVPALYYARVLENPSCRWSTFVCNQRGVRCDGSSALPSELAYCCDSETPKTIRERAWSSPIWYRPAASQ